MKLIRFGISAMALAMAGGTAFAQSAYPTASSRITVTGTVPLQCNDAVTVCLPPSTTNPVPVAVISGGGGGGGGTSGGTATSAAPTYTNNATGQALSLDLSGRLRVLASQLGTWNMAVTSALPAGSNTIGTVNVAGTVPVVPAVSFSTGNVDAGTQRVVLAANGPTVTTLSSIDGKTPALGQAVMASSVPVAIASNQSAVPVSGTFWQTTQPVSLTALPATENHLGEIGLRGIVATSSLTTPAGTTPYGANQLIANSATAGSVTPLSFTVCRVNGGTFQIDRVRVHTPDTGAAGQTVKVEFYQTSPTFTNGDHGAWLTTESGYMGEALVVFNYTFSDQYKGIGVPLGGILKGSCAGGSSTIYAAIQAGTAITPQGAKLWTVTIEATAN